MRHKVNIIQSICGGKHKRYMYMDGALKVTFLINDKKIILFNPASFHHSFNLHIIKEYAWLGTMYSIDTCQTFNHFDTQKSYYSLHTNTLDFSFKRHVRTKHFNSFSKG